MKEISQQEYIDILKDVSGKVWTLLDLLQRGKIEYDVIAENRLKLVGFTLDEILKDRDGNPLE